MVSIPSFSSADSRTCSASSTMSSYVKGVFPGAFKGGGFGSRVNTDTWVYALPQRVAHPSHAYYMREDFLLDG